MKPRTVRWIAGTCGAVALATPLAAGIGAGNWEAGFGIGSTEFDSEVSDDRGQYLDARGGYFLSNLFQIEGQFSGAEAESDGITTSLDSLFVNGVFNFRGGKRTVPYLLVGLGSTTLEYDFGDFKVDDDGVGYQAAVGSRFYVGRFSRMAVRVELSVLSENTFDERSTHTNLAVGLTWRIGKSR